MNEMLVTVWPGDLCTHRFRIFGAKIEDVPDLNAALDKASEENERHAVHLRIKDGKDIVFVQIAGLVARRIVCYLTDGQEVRTGERFGLIRFGSRTDIYLPEGVEPLVGLGQNMVGGETIIADLNGPNEGPMAVEVR